ncbi:MAG: hypothetical protein WEA34_11930 [Gemmatimonadota bacterium]
MTEDRKSTRLPPPAFPPGSRRHASANAAQAGAGSGNEAEAARNEAFYYPDGVSKDAFSLISPDDPFPDRDESLEEGTVTGIGDDEHLTPQELAAGGDPHVTALTNAVVKLAEALRHRGEAGLHASPDMGRFEATLRAYCVGYLAGRRAEVETGGREAGRAGE